VNASLRELEAAMEAAPTKRSYARLASTQAPARPSSGAMRWEWAIGLSSPFSKPLRLLWQNSGTALMLPDLTLQKYVYVGIDPQKPVE